MPAGGSPRRGNQPPNHIYRALMRARTKTTPMNATINPTITRIVQTSEGLHGPRCGPGSGTA